MLITENSIRQLIRKLILEKIRAKSGFSWQEFLDISNEYFSKPSYSDGTPNIYSTFMASIKLYDFLKDNLQLVGRGSSRAAFVLSSKYVLKIAFSEKRKQAMVAAGLKQNEHEVLVSKTSPQVQKIIPNVVKYDPNYVWIMSELVRPIDLPEWVSFLGFPFKYFDHLMTHLGQLRHLSDNDFDKMIDESYMDFVSSQNRTRGTNYPIKPAQTVRDFIKSIFLFCSENNVRIDDVVRSDHWGKTADGRIVLFDYGLTDDIWYKMY